MKIPRVFPIAITVILAGCLPEEESTGAAKAATKQSASKQQPSATSTETTPLAEWQQTLLDVAYRAVSGMPLNPHIKNRSRGQETVVVASLLLEQPDLARRYIGDIANWRRGAGYADLARFFADRGEPRQARHFLDHAIRVVHEVKADSKEQAWRADRIRSKAAAVYMLLSDADKAQELGTGVVDSEAGTVMAAQSRSVRTDADFDKHIAALDKMFENGNFEQVQAAMQACIELYVHSYDHESRRAELEKRVRTSYSQLPVQARIDALATLCDRAIKKDNKTKALELADEARGLLELAKWRPEDEVKVRSRLAALRYRAGGTDVGLADIDASLAIFDEQESNIYNVWKAAALRSIAEAYHGTGQTKKAQQVYARAIEAGVENPNSRPRAEDLAGTCVSMAVNGCEPPAELLARVQAVLNGLGNPW